MKAKVLIGGAIALSLLLACGAPAEQAPVAAEQGVDWENYHPSVRQRIDSMAASGDCAGLQDEFNTAETNSDAQRARTGDGNADLMRYIDDRMRGAGCYG
jgi:hypothetical protein